MIFFFDTETTGFVSKRLPFNHPDQPHLVQIAGKLTHDDGRLASQFSFIVNPGVAIPARASAVHGITDDVAQALGIAEPTAIRLFLSMVEKADVVVAHNVSFDRDVMRCAYARYMGAGDGPDYPVYCTMTEATPVINLPPTPKMLAAGFTKPKSPNLTECIRHFFDEDLEGAHDALADVTGCMRVYFHLQSLKGAAA